MRYVARMQQLFSSPENKEEEVEEEEEEEHLSYSARGLNIFFKT